MNSFSVELAREAHRERTRRLQPTLRPERRMRRRTADRLHRLARVIDPST